MPRRSGERLPIIRTEDMPFFAIDVFSLCIAENVWYSPKQATNLKEPMENIENRSELTKSDWDKIHWQELEFTKTHWKEYGKLLAAIASTAVKEIESATGHKVLSMSIPKPASFDHPDKQPAISVRLGRLPRVHPSVQAKCLYQDGGKCAFYVTGIQDINPDGEPAEG